MIDKKLLPVIGVLFLLIGFSLFMAAREKRNEPSTDTVSATTVESVDISESESEPSSWIVEPEPVTEKVEPESVPASSAELPAEAPASAEKPKSDDYSSAKYESQAHQAFENYGEYLCPYGIKYHWFKGMVSDYEGNGVWHLKVNVTITNAFNSTQEAVAEGRVDFNKEEVTEFAFLDTWD